ncbi:hypothetical protein [Roseivirga sp.]|uniref:hypothetical protein n=1 Tax=Roseivirga sp. TaxID=1964215 RepID=UPI002B270666|nr:hypothetical protein [Roseivirga sp.]
MKKKDFLEKYRINERDYDKCKFVWKELLAIKEDYDELKSEYEAAMKNIVEVVSGFNKVHSVRFRVKDSEHLIEKIIRKRIVDKNRVINRGNYRDEIKDLIGVRLLHLYKHDFHEINEQIKGSYDFVEKPTVNIRKGDNNEFWNNHLDNPQIHEHASGYRSVHYVIRTTPTKKTFFAEIQLRTIFEEGWSEVDHDLRYPNNMDNEILQEYLMMFNRIAGSADEMGSFIRLLTNNLQKRELELANKEGKISELTNELNEMIDKLKISKGEKDKLEEKIADLRMNSETKAFDPIVSSNGQRYNSTVLGGVMGASNSLNDVIGGASRLISAYGEFRCGNCGYSGKEIGNLMITGNKSRCPRCYPVSSF